MIDVPQPRRPTETILTALSRLAETVMSGRRPLPTAGHGLALFAMSWSRSRVFPIATVSIGRFQTLRRLRRWC